MHSDGATPPTYLKSALHQQPHVVVAVLCNAKIQQLLTFQVSSYCILILNDIMHKADRVDTNNDTVFLYVHNPHVFCEAQ